jgi:hypothetical protein
MPSGRLAILIRLGLFGIQFSCEIFFPVMSIMAISRLFLLVPFEVIVSSVVAGTVNRKKFSEIVLDCMFVATGVSPLRTNPKTKAYYLLIAR